MIKYSTCDSCSAPGVCCKGLAIISPPGVTHLDVVKAYPNFIFRRYLPKEVFGKDVGIYDCKWLNKSGRCSKYRQRPQLCRDYRSKQDPLCAEWKPTFKGIEIRVL